MSYTCSECGVELEGTWEESHVMKELIAVEHRFTTIIRESQADGRGFVAVANTKDNVDPLCDSCWITRNIESPYILACAKGLGAAMLKALADIMAALFTKGLHADTHRHELLTHMMQGLAILAMRMTIAAAGGEITMERLVEMARKGDLPENIDDLLKILNAEGGDE